MNAKAPDLNELLRALEADARVRNASRVKGAIVAAVDAEPLTVTLDRAHDRVVLSATLAELIPTAMTAAAQACELFNAGNFLRYGIVMGVSAGRRAAMLGCGIDMRELTPDRLVAGLLELEKRRIVGLSFIEECVFYQETSQQPPRSVAAAGC